MQTNSTPVKNSATLAISLTQMLDLFWTLFGPSTDPPEFAYQLFPDPQVLGVEMWRLTELTMHTCMHM